MLRESERAEWIFFLSGIRMCMYADFQQDPSSLRMRKMAKYFKNEP